MINQLMAYPRQVGYPQVYRDDMGDSTSYYYYGTDPVQNPITKFDYDGTRVSLSAQNENPHATAELNRCRENRQKKEASIVE